MTLDEAIKHAEEVAEENENNAQVWHKQTKNRLADFCDKAIQAENNCTKCAREHRQLVEWLKELKQLREQTKWIPVSERPPEKDKYEDFYKCLIAVSYTSRHNICDTVTAYFDGKHFYGNPYDTAFISGVKAWMPLPESYKAESEG